MNYSTFDGYLILIITWLACILILLVYFLFSNPNKRTSLPKKQKEDDPLQILREDTYSNEEVDEITGHMIREQYQKENDLK